MISQEDKETLAKKVHLAQNTENTAERNQITDQL